MSKQELRKKLQEKIQMKKVGRLTNTQKKQKVNEFCEKVGMSQDDVKSLTELSETMKKKLQK